MRLRPVRYFTLAISIGVLALCACSDDDSVGPPPPHKQNPPVWSEITDLAPSPTLYGMWVESENQITAVGRGGQIWQWNGVQWAKLPNGDGNDLFAVDGIANGGALAVGERGAMMKRVNGSFMKLDPVVSGDLHDVWTSSSGEFFIVGDDGLILRASPASHLEESPAVRTPLLSIWGASDTDIFATGADGAILHYDGGAWVNMTSPTTELLASIDGTSASDVYAAGSGGTIIHYDGNTWTPLTSHTTSLLQSCCAACGPGAAGANGTVLQWSSGGFHAGEISGSPWLYAMAHTANHTWVVGARTVLRHDGTAWSPETRGMIPPLRAVTSSSSTGLVTVGDNGSVMLGEPSEWHAEDAGALQRLNTVWTSPAGEIFAAGTNRIYRRTATGWVVENNEFFEYFDIGGNVEQALAVGQGGTIRQREGTAWKYVSPFIADLHAIYMTETEGFIVGNAGTVLTYVNKNWQSQVSRTNEVLWDVIPAPGPQYSWVAVGAHGVCIARPKVEGVGWTPISTGVTTTLYSLVAGADDDLYAVGEHGTVLRFVDDAWTPITAPTTRTFLGGWMHEGALFVCGGDDASGGFLFRYGPPTP